MATRRSPRSKDPGPDPLAELRIPVSDAQQFLREQIIKGEAIRDRSVSDRESLAGAHSDYSTWRDFNKEWLRRAVTTNELAEEFGRSVRMMYSLGPSSLREDIDDFRSDIGTHLRRLNSIRERLPLLQGAGGEVTAAEASASLDLRRVFVVHGHDLGAVDRVVRLLRELDLEAVVLRDQPNQGRTIIEKFEAHSDVSYAIVLMTGDDEGKRSGSGDDPQLRARQNVVLELGFFVGRLSRRRVAALVEQNVEVPSDIDGVLYIPFGTDDTWRLLLAKEMRSAGLNVDLNKL